MNDRFSPVFELKRANIQDSGIFSGYASTFGGPPDAYGEVIQPGAFTKTLLQHTERGTMPAMLWSHDQSTVLGRWTELTETPLGLKVQGKLTLAVEKAREAHALMRDNALALSIGFRVPEGGSKWVGRRRILSEIELFEISTVAVPADSAAKITSVKSIRDFETGLRDELGFSARQAKKIASHGYHSIERDAPWDETEIRNLAQKINSMALSIKSMR